MNFKGIAVSQGVVVSKVLKIESENINIIEQATSPEKELKSYNDALLKNINELEQIKERLSKTNPEEASIFEAHILLLNDPEIKKEIEGLISNESKSAMKAVDTVMQNYINIFENIDDDYMRERASDLKDLKHKLLATLAGVTLFDLSKIDEEVILVAHDLTPSQTAQLNKKFIKAFATQIGSRTSHSAIMARSLNIPAVVGIDNIMNGTKNGDTLALNGITGEVIINPDQNTIKKFNEEQVKIRIK